MAMQGENPETQAAAGGGTAGQIHARSSTSHAASHNHELRHRVLRIRITDIETGRLKVGLTLHASLVSVAVRMGARLVPPGHDPTDLLAAIERAELPEPFVVDDEQNGERVEISMEG
ncbi:MAG: hypothetical protein M3380_20110 [Chloroflexota bacterium]|nr:hypothetical protein [Chloroflexota bacterium]